MYQTKQIYKNNNPLYNQTNGTHRYGFTRTESMILAFQDTRRSPQEANKQQRRNHNLD